MTCHVVLDKRMLVDKRLMPEKAVEQRFTVQLFDEKTCAKCDNLEARLATGPNELCQTCPAFEANYRLYRDVEYKGRSFWSVPQGDAPALLPLLERRGRTFRTHEQRPAIPFAQPIRFTGRLFGAGHVDENGIPRVDQRKLARTWWEHKNGIIKARPRAGKCLTGDALISTTRGWLHMNELGFAPGLHPHILAVDTPYGVRTTSHSYTKTAPTLRLRTRNGFELGGTYEHPVLVLTSDLQLKWRRLDTVQVGDYIVSTTLQNTPQYSATNACSLSAARVMGWLTANGRDACLSSDDYAVVQAFHASVHELGYPLRVERSAARSTNHHIGNNFIQQLRTWGYTAQNNREKCIPHAVRTSTRDILHAYLTAYFECDSGRNGRIIELCTASGKLAQQLHVILQHAYSITGVRVRIRKSATNSNNPMVRTYHIIQLSGRDAHRFAEQFPTAKASKNWIVKDTVARTSQEVEKDHIPYLGTILRKTYKRARVSNNPMDQRVQLADGTVVHNFGMPVRIRAGHNIPLRDISRASFDRADWAHWIPRLAQLDPTLSQRIARLVETGATFERVTHITRGQEQSVYDVTIPDGHAFTANGLAVHNTVVAVAIACRLGLRTVIMANRKRLLKQFYRTFVGDANRAPMSNIPDIRTNTGREVIRWAQKPRDLTNLQDVDILLVNYQKLVRDPESFRALIDDHFSFLVVDEVHGTGAEGYLRVAASCSVKHRLGLSATPRRKDGRHSLVARIMGPVVAESESVSLIPSINFYESAVHPPRAYKVWQHAFGWMCRSRERNIEILRQIFRDLRAGHSVIILPVDWKIHQANLVMMINHQARMNNVKRGEDWPEDLAIAYNHKSDEETVFERVDDGRPCVLVGIRSMIREGVDMERPSKIYVILPMSASTDRSTGAPMFDQLANRISSPAKKPQPEILIWLDNVQMFRNTISGLFWNEILPNRYRGGDRGKYRIQDSDIARMKELNRRKRAPQNRMLETTSGGWT